ncbi:MAG: protein kinase [Thiocapsa sp.]|uniref:protein kinase domain-containing protein n=1 Tax=Thiocapsa sp. TaxID=2024551 RepID=UPI001BCCF6B2|nr:protein kinase [Thiocapsa sp.]QVL49464.1 MAG: protein kinase [Thiocapsa sp.]
MLDGRYRIGRVLGHGGFGITYLARDENLHLRLAIKEYLPRDCATRAPDGVSLAVYSGPAGEQFAYGLDRFLDEARALARFDQHPGIVTVKSFFRAHGTGYCVMDYVDGLTFKDHLAQQPNGRIPMDAAIKLLTPVMDALRAVHKEGLLHRDLAPDNIYLSRDGRIKLLDFGAARFAAGEHSRSLSIILKPGYAPEEQYRTRGKQGPWTDVYGLAATLYRAITGSVPPEALDRLDQDEIVPPSKLGAVIASTQERVLLKALAVRAGDRYSGIAEFQQALQEPAASWTLTPPGRGQVAQPPPPASAEETSDNDRSAGANPVTFFFGVLSMAIVSIVLMAIFGDWTTSSEAARASAAPAHTEIEESGRAREFEEDRLRLLRERRAAEERAQAAAPARAEAPPVNTYSAPDPALGSVLYPPEYAGLTTPTWCRGAETANERLICGNAGAARADAVMGAVYNDLRVRLSGGSFALIRSEQRDWLKRRNTGCANANAAANAACLQDMTEQRLAELLAEQRALSGG